MIRQVAKSEALWPSAPEGAQKFSMALSIQIPMDDVWKKTCSNGKPWFKPCKFQKKKNIRSEWKEIEHFGIRVVQHIIEKHCKRWNGWRLRMCVRPNWFGHQQSFPKFQVPAMSVHFWKGFLLMKTTILLGRHACHENSPRNCGQWIWWKWNWSRNITYHQVDESSKLWRSHAWIAWMRNTELVDKNITRERYL